MSMHQPYMAPRLTRHGTVGEITGWRFEGDQTPRHEAAALVDGLVDGATRTNYSIDGVVMRLEEEELAPPSRDVA